MRVIRYRVIGVKARVSSSYQSEQFIKMRAVCVLANVTFWHFAAFFMASRMGPLIGP